MSQIPNVIASLKVPATPDLQTAQGKADLDEQEKNEDIKKKQLENLGLADDLTAKKLYSKRVFQVTCIWLILVVLIFAAQGIFGQMQSGVALSHTDKGVVAQPLFLFHLPENLLITLAATTTANVIGILLVVVKHLFPDRKTP